MLGTLGHLEPRMFTVSVSESLSEGGGNANSDPHLFTRWSPLCPSLSPSLFFYSLLSLCFLSRGLCVECKDVQRVSPSCASGTMNCLITAASSLQGHPSSVKQNFLSVWSPRHHFHICIFLLPVPLFYPFRVTGALAHKMFLVEAGREMEGRQGDGVAATGSPWPCPQGAADSPSHYP